MATFPQSTPEPAPEDPQAGAADADFEALLADAQPRLRGYVASILGGHSDADDVVQETNLILAAKKDSFKAGTNFMAWAFRIAFFKATTWRRDRLRAGRVVVFGEAAFQDVAAAAEEYFTERPPVLDALADCLQSLPASQRELITAKYFNRQALVDLAASCGCSANSLHKMISRIRLALRKCVSETLKRERP